MAIVPCRARGQTGRVEDFPTILGYRILAKLGSGGMGNVYRAQHLALGREVALKVVDIQGQPHPLLRARVLREARALASVTHPRVVTCYDAGEDGGLLYLAMEILAGGDCARLVATGKVPAKRALAIIRDAAEGAQALHRAGLVHRDIKPSNIFLDHEGRAKLADLGLVRQVADADHLTASNTVLGTPAFLSPEQALGKGDLDARSDCFSLGGTLFALVAGRNPFSGTSPWMTVAEILRDPTPDPLRHVPDLPAPVRALIRRCMARDPRARYASMADLLAAIDLAAAAPSRPVQATLAPHRTRPSARLVLGIVGVTIGVALLGALALGSHGRGATVPDAAPLGAGAAPPLASVPAPPPPVLAAAPSSAVGTPLPPLHRVLPPQMGPLSGPPDAGHGTASRPAAPQEAWAIAQGQDAAGAWADLPLGPLSLRLRFCPRGSFSMGSPEDEAGRYGNEQAHPVTLTHSFWLGATEVTQGQWQQVTGQVPSLHLGTELPVERVSWSDCQVFLARLARTSHAPVRLPSEAEWEYACRAGTSTAFHGDPVALSWNRANAQGQEHPVATRTANPWGLSDMYGNVWEWCQDAYAPLTAQPETDPLVADGFQHVIRGGSYRFEASDCRSALRDGASSAVRRDSIGLRLAITASGATTR